MALVRRIGYGFTLSVDKTGGSSFASIGSIVDGWKGPMSKAEKVDTSILADLFKLIDKGQIDPGELTFVIAHDPGDTATKLLGDCLVLAPGSTIPTWQITGPAGYASKTFSGHVLALGEDVSRNKMNTLDVTVGVSGNPGYAHS